MVIKLKKYLTLPIILMMFLMLLIPYTQATELQGTSTVILSKDVEDQIDSMSCVWFTPYWDADCWYRVVELNWGDLEYDQWVTKTFYMRNEENVWGRALAFPSFVIYNVNPQILLGYIDVVWTVAGTQTNGSWKSLTWWEVMEVKEVSMSLRIRSGAGYGGSFNFDIHIYGFLVADFDWNSEVNIRDGQYIAAVDFNGYIYSFNRSSPSPIMIYHGNGNASSVDISSDGQTTSASS